MSTLSANTDSQLNVIFRYEILLTIKNIVGVIVRQTVLYILQPDIRFEKKYVNKSKAFNSYCISKFIRSTLKCFNLLLSYELRQRKKL